MSNMASYLRTAIANTENGAVALSINLINSTVFLGSISRLAVPGTEGKELYDEMFQLTTVVQLNSKAPPVPIQVVLDAKDICFVAPVDDAMLPPDPSKDKKPSSIVVGN